ncbi:hypothetical protein [Pyxidicoccus xibeiensis]|uniref:hypothetical protein n=1 Tax=Pyxidicoccus xibeiensis TaxID=2906759 RepID=UPI0020A720C2|nr:hypothetical protein [Pyxidicoccus xibeiensis]MCP3142767.1 hypothetical protein [Pyxidicoccus xibeiensis]
MGAALMQALVAPYLLLAGLMAAEMSAVLSAVLLASGGAVAVATLFLFRRRVWAWRLSSALAVLAFVAGGALAFMSPHWLGGIHAVGAAIILAALWAGRRAVMSQRAPSSA